MTHAKFAICTDVSGYEASLELRKLYQLLPDATALSSRQLRVVDESGEDYLYPSSYFFQVDLPDFVVNQIAYAA